MSHSRWIIVLLLSAMLVGCSISIGDSGSWGGGSTSCSSDQLDGYVAYKVIHGTHGGKVFLVIVVDGTGGLHSMHSGSTFEGEFGTLDGRSIAWKCQASDARTGTVTIGGADFQLENGGLFLLSARHGKTWIRQTQADLSPITGTVDLAAVQSVTQDDALTTEFLERLQKPKPTPRDPVLTPAND